MFNSIYALPLGETLFNIFMRMVRCQKDYLCPHRKPVHLEMDLCHCFAALDFFVLKATVLFRGQKVLPPIWTPFQQIYDLTQGGNLEILRSIWMNILLFIPGGVILPELLPAKWRNRSKVILTVVLAMLFSLSIELAQWHWQLGQAETDDVIANTLGALLGCGIFILGNRIISRKRNV